VKKNLDGRNLSGYKEKLTAESREKGASQMKRKKVDKRKVHRVSKQPFVSQAPKKLLFFEN